MITEYINSHQSAEEFKKNSINVAYFSMEIGIDPNMPTYSGGLGVLAGDTIRSCSDLKVPMIAVTLLYKRGYFTQKLDEWGNQKEFPTEWDPAANLKLLPNKIQVKISGRDVSVQAWQYDTIGQSGHIVPILFLDTNLPENTESDREITAQLYGGDQRYRLCQEIVLGIGGVRMLESLRYGSISKYHMNEGHASLLVLELLHQIKKQNEVYKLQNQFKYSNIILSEDVVEWDLESIQEACVFTTHTPVPAGHDQFPYELVYDVLGEFVPYDILKKLAGEQSLNMTLIALNASKYINGVAKKHAEVSRSMFPTYSIDAITNGVHSYTWTSDSFRSLFDKYIPGWRQDPFTLRDVLSVPTEEIWDAHLQEKQRLFDYIEQTTGKKLDVHALTIGFARRSATYKRADLVFHDIERLKRISERAGKIQFVFAGKAHPADEPGKDLIRRIFQGEKNLQNSKIEVVYLENYNMNLGRLITSGVDVWLNTPKRPNEASGTSGMKATHNGVPNFSILDGWWIEGHIEGHTGWSIGSTATTQDDNKQDADELYNKLEYVIAPHYYHNKTDWINIMQKSIALNASFFNTHRMVLQYVLNSYFLTGHAEHKHLVTF